MNKKRLSIYVELDSESEMSYSQSITNRQCLIVPSPKLYEIHAEDYSELKAPDSRQAIQILIATLLPDHQDRYYIDSVATRLRDGGCRAVGVAVKKQHLDKIRESFPKATLSIPVTNLLIEKQTGVFRVENGNRIDCFCLDEFTAHPIESSSNDIDLFNDPLSKHQRFFRTQFLNRRDRVLFASLSVFFITTICTGAMALTNRSLNEKANAMQYSHGVSLERKRELELSLNTLESEETILASIKAEAPHSPYALLSILSRILPEDSVTTSIVIKGDRFIIRGESSGVLSLVQQLESESTLMEIQLEQILPTDRGQHEVFTITGRFDVS